MERAGPTALIFVFATLRWHSVCQLLILLPQDPISLLVPSRLSGDLTSCAGPWPAWVALPSQQKSLPEGFLMEASPPRDPGQDGLAPPGAQQPAAGRARQEPCWSPQGAAVCPACAVHRLFQPAEKGVSSSALGSERAWGSLKIFLRITFKVF